MKIGYNTCYIFAICFISSSSTQWRLYDIASYEAAWIRYTSAVDVATLSLGGFSCGLSLPVHSSKQLVVRNSNTNHIISCTTLSFDIAIWIKTLHCGYELEARPTRPSQLGPYGTRTQFSLCSGHAASTVHHWSAVYPSHCGIPPFSWLVCTFNRGNERFRKYLQECVFYMKYSLYVTPVW